VVVDVVDADLRAGALIDEVDTGPYGRGKSVTLSESALTY